MSRPGNQAHADCVIVQGVGDQPIPAPAIPIQAAARRLAELAREISAADPITRAIIQAALHVPILNPVDAVLVLTVAASDVFCAIGFTDSEEWAEQSLAAVARATRFLAGVHGVELADLDDMPGAGLDRGRA